MTSSCRVGEVCSFSVFSLGPLWFRVFFQWVWQSDNEDVCTHATTTHCCDSSCVALNYKKEQYCHNERTVRVFNDESRLFRHKRLAISVNLLNQ